MVTFALDIHPTVLKVTENVVMIKLWAERITQEVCQKNTAKTKAINQNTKRKKCCLTNNMAFCYCNIIIRWCVRGVCYNAMVRTHLKSPWVWGSKFKVIRVSEKYIGSLENLDIWRKCNVPQSTRKKERKMVLEGVWQLYLKIDHLVLLADDIFLVYGVLETLEFLRWNVIERSLNV